MTIGPGARRLKTTRYEKVWGTTNLSPIFSTADEKIGEVWFEDEEPLPLLFKFLFTSERLSIQVHPEVTLTCTSIPNGSDADPMNVP